MFCALLTASAQQTKQLVILHTSDNHSRIEPIDLHAADPYAGAGGGAACPRKNVGDEPPV